MRTLRKTILRLLLLVVAVAVMAECGMSWKKDIGFFERTSDMVFALERRTEGKKVKQVPVIRRKD